MLECQWPLCNAARALPLPPARDLRAACACSLRAQAGALPRVRAPLCARRTTSLDFWALVLAPGFPGLPCGACQ
eukprot:637665-Alexandrium_andersonii.AAC.1